MSFYEKYLKYKEKYLELKKQLGGAKAEFGRKNSNTVVLYLEETINWSNEDLKPLFIGKDLNNYNTKNPKMIFFNFNRDVNESDKKMILQIGNDLEKKYRPAPVLRRFNGFAPRPDSLEDSLEERIRKNINIREDSKASLKSLFETFMASDTPTNFKELFTLDINGQPFVPTAAPPKSLIVDYENLMHYGKRHFNKDSREEPAKDSKFKLPWCFLMNLIIARGYDKLFVVLKDDKYHKDLMKIFNKPFPLRFESDGKFIHCKIEEIKALKEKVTSGELQIFIIKTESINERDLPHNIRGYDDATVLLLLQKFRSLRYPITHYLTKDSYIIRDFNRDRHLLLPFKIQIKSIKYDSSTSEFVLTESPRFLINTISDPLFKSDIPSVFSRHQLSNYESLIRDYYHSSLGESPIPTTESPATEKPSLPAP
jgi:hypothetical protein